MKFRPLYDRVVVRRVDGEGRTKGGIIIQAPDVEDSVVVGKILEGAESSI